MIFSGACPLQRKGKPHLDVTVKMYLPYRWGACSTAHCEALAALALVCMRMPPACKQSSC